ncbi:uncharacterized protein LOC112441402 isoform X1 [Pan paniscus]|uniref:uncharacterized protein LOC112441402 isoform X1 n=1 Tax=Pan paniscus TaxID=9597 RepID=UPI001561615E|nr:uncharacterized protein LOC112441402 isoform X1 [Pan paniscus]
MISGQGARLLTGEPVWRGCLSEVCWDAPGRASSPRHGRGVRKSSRKTCRLRGLGRGARRLVTVGREACQRGPPQPSPAAASSLCPAPGTPGSTSRACALRSLPPPRRPRLPAWARGCARRSGRVRGSARDSRFHRDLGRVEAACRDPPGSSLPRSRGERLYRAAKPAVLEMLRKGLLEWDGPRLHYVPRFFLGDICEWNKI